MLQGVRCRGCEAGNDYSWSGGCQGCTDLATLGDTIVNWRPGRALVVHWTGDTAPVQAAMKAQTIHPSATEAERKAVDLTLDDCLEHFQQPEVGPAIARTDGAY